MKIVRNLAFVVSWSCLGSTATRADVLSLGSGENRIEIEFVDIGAVGNPHDQDPRLHRPTGSVDYPYAIAKFETSCGVVSAASRQGAGIFGTAGFICPESSVLPFGSSELLEAVRFVNWINVATGYSPAYADLYAKTSWPEDDPGYNPENPVRNSLARFFLPTTDEWYKAGHYDPVNQVYYDYATGSDEIPIPITTSGNVPGTAVFCTWGEGLCPDVNQPQLDVFGAGGPSPFGTVGQLGNAEEFEENGFYRGGRFACQPAGACDFDGPIPGIPNRAIEGWSNRHQGLTGFRIGFRIVDVQVPEPSGSTMVWIVVWSLLLLRPSRMLCL